MKVIYTYKQYKQEPFHITDYGIDMIRISVEASNKFYKTHLYCCSDSYEVFKKNEIPFTEITILDELDELPKGENSLWSWSKIVSMKYQEEPWIHLDFDSVLTKPFDGFDEDVVFGFPDFYVDSKYKTITPSSIEQLYDLYLYWFYKIHNNNGNKQNWNFNEIPNASFIYCGVPNKVKNVIEKFERENRWIIDKRDWSDYNSDKVGELCCYFEQFLFTKYLKDNLLKVKILNIDGYNNASDDVRDILEKDYLYIKNYMDNGFFHFPLYKILSPISLNKIYSLLWNHLNISHPRKFKLPI